MVIIVTVLVQITCDKYLVIHLLAPDELQNTVHASRDKYVSFRCGYFFHDFRTINACKTCSVCVSVLGKNNV